MKKILSTVAISVLGLATAYAQYCPTQQGTVLKYQETVEQPEHAVKIYTETIDSVYVEGDKTTVRLLTHYDPDGSLASQPDQRSYCTYTTANAAAEPTVVTMMSNEDFRQLIINQIREEIAASGQMVSPQDFDAVASQIRPTGKLQLILDPSAAEGSKISNSSLRVNLGIGANMSVHLSSGKVLGTEEITVPAGTFSCFKISYVIKRSAGPETEKLYVTDWYAEGIGLVKEEAKDKSGAIMEFTELKSIERP